MNVVDYRTGTAVANAIAAHLERCSGSFVPPLDQKVDIEEYAKKIQDKAITFEAWNKEELVGLIAAYFNDEKKEKGFITSVSVESNFGGKGISSELMKLCMNYGKEKGFKEIHLEVNEQSAKAIGLYKKFGFGEYERKSDAVFMKVKL